MSEMRIAFVGVPGSGKTVLLSAFALAYRRSGFIPRTSVTQDFCDDAERTLPNGEWPPPTLPQGGQKEFCWEYRDWMVHVCDIAGEDWIEIARNEQEESVLQSQDDSDVVALWKKVVKQFYCSDVIFIVLDVEKELNGRKNLKQYDLVESIRNIFKKEGTDFRETRVCFVVTKTETLGGRARLEKIVDPYLRLIDNLNLLRYTPNIIYVDAVADTTTDANGILVPAQDFHSIGLENILLEIDRHIDHVEEAAAKIKEAEKTEAGCLKWFAVTMIVIGAIIGVVKGMLS